MMCIGTSAVYDYCMAWHEHVSTSVCAIGLQSVQGSLAHPKELVCTDFLSLRYLWGRCRSVWGLIF